MWLEGTSLDPPFGKAASALANTREGGGLPVYSPSGGVEHWRPLKNKLSLESLGLYGPLWCLVSSLSHEISSRPDLSFLLSWFLSNAKWHGVALGLPRYSAAIFFGNLRFKAERSSHILCGGTPTPCSVSARASLFYHGSSRLTLFRRWWHTRLEIYENLDLLKRTVERRYSGWCEGFQGFLPRVIILSAAFYMHLFLSRVFLPLDQQVYTEPLCKPEPHTSNHHAFRHSRFPVAFVLKTLTGYGASWLYPLWFCVVRIFYIPVRLLPLIFWPANQYVCPLIIL